MARSLFLSGEEGLLRFEVEHVRRERKHEVDELNNDVWVDVEVSAPVKVAGWSSPSSDEPKIAGHDRLTVDVELLAPVGVFSARDAVRLPDRDDLMEVVGEPENYSFNPFGWDPGLEVVNLSEVKP